MMSLTRVVAIFERRAKIAVRPDRPGNAQILFPDRFVEMIFGLQVAFDFRRRRRAFAVERPAGRDMHQPNASALMTSSSGTAKMRRRMKYMLNHEIHETLENKNQTTIRSYSSFGS